MVLAQLDGAERGNAGRNRDVAYLTLRCEEIADGAKGLFWCGRGDAEFRNRVVRPGPEHDDHLRTTEFDPGQQRSSSHRRERTQIPWTGFAGPFDFRLRRTP